MVEDDSKTSDTTKPASKRAHERKASGRGVLAGGLALILSATALIASGFMWYTLLHERPELLATDVVGNLERLKGETSAMRENLAAANLNIDEVRSNQDNMRTALDKIQNDLLRHRSEWVTAESERLLVIANNRLQLARDVRSALAALRSADAQLNQIANPALLPVRRELAREIATLEAIDRVDVGGISLKLGSFAESVDRLAIAPDVMRRAGAAPETQVAAAATDAATGWRTQARDFWHDMLSLVRIRTDVDVQRPLLPPEQEYFLRENLKLMLYSAQAALLQGSADVFKQNLRSADQLLRDYFDTDAQVVAGMRAELEKMRASKLVTELPDISRSLAALRAVIGTGTGTRGAAP